ncbi:GntR family transcriptional regulator [Oscillospiraceae bacterium MB08-C2-2]|nr:GntR family transcriptional regulator [Oscillospiraceae bacterium MB08-C2-2]
MKQPAKYQQLADRLRSDILSGDYQVGQRLPSENELGVTSSLSRQTVRQALALLETEGLIERRQGSGSIVTKVTAHREQSRNVAVITTYISEYIFPDILRGIEEILAQNNYSPIISATKNRVDNERKLLEDFLGKNLDGLIIEGTKTALPNPNIDLYQKFYNLGIPIVFVHGYYPDLKNPIYVIANDFEGGEQATNFLINKGHKKIAGLFKSDDIQGHRRYAGYINALKKNGLPINDDHILWYTTESRKSLISSSALEIIGDCTAVVCYNDEVGVQVLSILQDAGKAIPEDVAIISFDNSIYSELASVKITSCSQHKKQTGMLAAEKLLNLIHGIPQSSTVLPWTITEKKST